jgi:hypothetical protein
MLKLQMKRAGAKNFAPNRFLCEARKCWYIAMQTRDFSEKAHFAIYKISVVGVLIFGAANNGARAVEMNVRWSSRQNVDRARRMGNGRTCLSEPTPYPHRDDEGERKCVYIISALKSGRRIKIREA